MQKISRYDDSQRTQLPRVRARRVRWRLAALCAGVLAAAFLSGCRLGRYELTEPIKSQFIEVNSGERWTFELDENRTTGYEWIASSSDNCVDVIVGHREPENTEGLCGVPGKAVVTVRIRRGFAGPSELLMKYQRSWSDEVAREIKIVFYRKTGDHAPWK